ncbi:MAG: hypothetical protein GX348_04940 [Veillonellaceae bacterium]|jgi:hypothetical protein|nr:hypothetical protein [Veillonellaceae bacterium]
MSNKKEKLERARQVVREAQELVIKFKDLDKKAVKLLVKYKQRSND